MLLIVKPPAGYSPAPWIEGELGGVMRRWLALLLALTAGCAAGCFAGHTTRAASLFEPLRPLLGPTGTDAVQLDVALIERPTGDRFLNEELWDLADEQGVAFEKKAALDDNGIRVGLIGGMPPAGLQALLTSERSCANPRRCASRPATACRSP